MENFNSKLYEKYNNLKKRKFAEVEERNQKRNVDVAKYQSAVEGLIEDLKNENDKLRAEMVSIQEEFHECQQLLLQERHKTKMLSNGVETLKHLLLQENNDDRAPLMSPHRSPIVRLDDSNEFLQKGNMEGTQNAVVVKDASIITNGMTNEKTIMPDCCRRTMTVSGDGKSFSQCAFQILVELLVGLKFSVDCQNSELSLSVIHQMSGYSFTLSWVRPEDELHGDLRYQVSSLGTIEGIASEWMKEDILFSMAMCPVFFERLSQTINI